MTGEENKWSHKVEVRRHTLMLPNGDRDRERHVAYAYEIWLVVLPPQIGECLLATYSQEDRFYSSIKDYKQVRSEAFRYAGNVIKVLGCSLEFYEMKSVVVETTKLERVPFTVGNAELQKIMQS